jgi:hypothetical protein
MSIIVKLGDARGLLSRSVLSHQILIPEDKVTCRFLHSPAPAMLDSKVDIESLEQQKCSRPAQQIRNQSP